MACEIQTDKYISVVQDLIKINAPVYRNFDNTARFILKSDLTPEQKKLSIHNFAHIYNGVAGLNKDFWQPGKAEDLINAVHLLDNTKAYIEFAAQTFGVDVPGKVTMEQINKAIANLGAIKHIRQEEHLTGPSGIFSMFRNFLETNDLTEEDKDKAIVDFRIAMRSAINLHTASPTYNDVLNQALDRFSAKLKKFTPYVPLREIMDQAGLAPVLVTMSDRQVREGYLDEDNKPVLVGETTPLENDQYISYVKAYPEDDANHVESNFNEDFFVSNMRVKAAGKGKQKEVDEMLGAMENPRSGVRIMAVKLGNSDERLQKIKELAASNPKYAELANRNHETSENNAQIAYLQSNPGSNIIGVARLTESEHGFGLVGEIIETGELFNLYTLDNYVVINSDNTTTKLDFKNPGHVEIMKRMAQKNTSAGKMRLLDSDIISLQNQLVQFQEFRDGMLKDVKDVFDEGFGSVDITNKFFDTFSFNKVRPQNNPSLDKALEFDKQLSLSVNIAEFDEEGNVTSESARKLPFVYSKSEGVYQLVNMLGSNEKIAISTIDGVEYKTQAQYVTDVLLPNEVLSESGALDVDEFLTNTILKGNARQEKIALRFNNDQKVFSYAPVNTKKGIGNLPGFASFITKLSEIINSKSDFAAKNKKLLALAQNDFFFANGKHFFINFDFNFAGQLKIELKAKDPQGPYGMVLDAKGKSKNEFKFVFYPADQETLANMGDLFKTKSTLIADITRETPSLRAYNLVTADGQTDFFNALEILAENHKLGPKGVKFMQKVQEAKDEFVDMLDEIASRIESQTEDIPGFYEEFIKDYKSPERLFYYTDEEGVRTPFIHISKYNSGFAKFNGNLRNWTVVKSSHGRMAVVSNASLPVSSAAKTIMDSTPPVGDGVGSYVAAANAGTAVQEAPSVRNEKRIAELNYVIESWQNEVLPMHESDRARLIYQREMTTSDLLKEKLTKDIADYDDAIQKVKDSIAGAKLAIQKLEGKSVETTETTEKKSKFKRSEDSPFKIADEYTPATDQEVLTEASWLAQNLPQFGLDQTSLADVINLSKIDGTVLGAFKDKVIYLNGALKAKGVVYHEAFHGVFRYLMDNDQRRALLDHVIGQAKYSNKFKESTLKEFARVRNLKYDEAKIKDLIAEEILADGFQSYMNKKSKPKGIIAQLMEVLKNLINFFIQNKDLIDNTYNDIATGHYKSAVINSGMFDGQIAFEIIDGLREIYTDEVGEITTRPSSVSTYEQNQLVNMMVKQILDDTTKRGFEQKFDSARRHLIDSVYNVDLYIRQNPAKEKEIKEFVGKLYNQYRFMLGARSLGIAVPDINSTGDKQFDNENDYNEVNGLDNTDGSQSLETLKALVKDRVGEIVIIGSTSDKDLDSEKIEAALSGENENVIEDENADLLEETSKDSFDGGINEYSRLDSIPAQFRKFLATIRRDIENKELGVTFPHMVDARAMFPVLLKISSNIDPENIIKHIKLVYEMMREDGYAEAAYDIQAIFDEIKEKTKMDDDGNVMNDNQLYNMIVNVLHGSELDYYMTTLYNPNDDTDEDKISIADVENTSETRFTLKEKIQAEDKNSKRRELIQGIITGQVAAQNSPEYLKDWLTIKKISMEIAAEGGHILGGMNPTEHLNRLTDRMHAALLGVGFNLPKSLIKLSIMGIDVKENNKPLNVSDKELERYEANKMFVDENEYLEKQFFSDLVTIAGLAIDKKDLKSRLDDAEVSISKIKSFHNILRRASAYIVKYDPTKLNSVIRNAEGKPIYRYVKYTPMLTMTQKIRRMGLAEAVKEDDEKFFNLFLQDFLGNNYMLGEAMKGEDTEKAKKAQLFLDNLRVSMFGGAQQVIGGIYKDGKSFKDLDRKTMFITGMLAFMERTTKTGTKKGKDAANEISTYLRSFGQLESSNTNFLITGLYQKYAGVTGIHKNADKHYKIVDDLVGAIAQEYSRIQKEWARREENKKLYEENLENRILDNFNGRLDADGKTVVFTDEKGNDLRAYQFGKLADFFQNYEDGKDIGESLREAAKSNIDFENIDPEDLKDLRNALNKYAQSQFDKHMQTLQRYKIIEKMEVERKGTSESKQKYYYSALLPGYFKNDFQKVELEEAYGKTKIAQLDGSTQMHANLENFAADYFFNDWANTLHFNDLFDGDAAMNIKNAVDMVKRNKKWLATGDNGRQGVHTAAVMRTITAFIHDSHRTKGPYYYAEEIDADFAKGNLTVEQYEQIKEGFDLAKAGDPAYKDMMHKIFDGQSFSLLMHQMDMHESRGRLNSDAIEILIASQYRELTQGEILRLEALKIVNNSKKTITSSRVNYFKMSESMIHRDECSFIKPEVLARAGENPEEALEAVQEMLHDMWRQVYDLRKQYQDSLKNGMVTEANGVMDKIKNTVKTIHSFYAPIPSRKALHNILNSMEYHQIDHLMDNEASKNATLLPIDVFANNVFQDKMEGEYLPLHMAAVEVKNEYKYSQVETSGVSDRAKISVQAKVLLPADLDRLAEIMTKANGRELTEAERTSVDNISDKLLSDYNSTLKDSTESRLLYLTTIMRQGGDFAIDQVYDIIRENLTLQGASTPLLKMFTLKDVVVDNPADPANPIVKRVPVYSPNEPQIRKVLQYYFFSQYSKHVTDEKGSGTKSIHVSSFGYDVMVDNTTGEVIKTKDYNPAVHTDITVRPLSVTEQPELNVDGKPTGKTVYYVECILPKPFMNNPKAIKFFEDYLSRMFATRIPTEDKRSMIALKVVDYMDSSKMNSIVVPHFVHILAGSDFDVDALFMHGFSHYVDMAGESHVYGNYENYDNIRQGKFSEFVHFMMRRGEFSDLIAAREKEIRESGELELDNTGKVFSFLKTFGYTDEDFKNVLNLAEINQKYQELDNFIDDITDLRAQKKEELTQYIDDYVKGNATYGVKGKRNSLEELHRDIKRGEIDRKVEISNMTDERWAAILEKRRLNDIARRARSFALAAMRTQAAFDVLSKYNVPTSITEFEANETFGKLVVDKFQNQNLQAKLNIMTNPVVFENLWINETSSVERFEQIMSSFGISMNTIASMMNHYTVDAKIEAKAGNSMNKDGIGITANINKFLAMCSWYKAELKEPVWQFYKSESDKDQAMYKTFGNLNDENIRTIALIGNILGMFADGAKKPIPSALKMNEVNAGVSLAMIGVGLSPEFALGFNFIPEIISAADETMASKYAINDDVRAQPLYLTRVLKTKIQGIINANPDVAVELKNRGLLVADTKATNVVLDKNNLVIDFEAQNLDSEKFINNTLNTSEIGYTVSSKVPGKELTLEAQKVVLLKLYMDQAQQSFAIGRAGKLTNLFKALNPSFAVFDKTKEAVEELFSEDSIFTEDTLDRMKNDQVWEILREMMNDLDHQSSLLFLDRSEFFKPLKNIFDKIFKDKETIAKTVVGFVGLTKLRDTLPGSRVVSDAVVQTYIDAEDKALKDSFTAEYWWTHNLGEELIKFQQKYPKNRFLQVLREAKGDDFTTFVMPDGKKKARQPMRFIRLINSLALKGTDINDVANDAAVLALDRDGKLFLKKLLYHEYARTGLGHTAGTFMYLLPPEMRKPVSDNIIGFTEMLEKGAKDPEDFDQLMRGFFDMSAGESKEKIYNFFTEMVTKLAHAAVTEANNTSIPFMQDLKLNIDKSDESFNSAFIKSLKGTDTMSTKETRTAALSVLETMFGKAKGSIDIGVAKKFTVKPKNLGDSFILNMAPDNKYATGATMQVLANTFLGYGSMVSERAFRFPMVINVKGTSYILAGVDGTVTSGSIGENVYESIVNGGGLKTQGTVAKYVKMSKKMVGTSLSPIGFDGAEVSKYESIAARKGQITLDQNQAESVKADAKAEKEQKKGPAKKLTPKDLVGQATEEEENEMGDGPETSDEDLMALLASMGVDTSLIPGAALSQMTEGKPEEKNKPETPVLPGSTTYDVQEQLKNLDMTPEAVQYLYRQMENPTKSIQQFADEAMQMVTLLRGKTDNESILENIKCLLR